MDNYEAMGAHFTTLQPGESIKVGCAWDGTFYVVHAKSVPYDWLAPIKQMLSRGATVLEAWNAEQEEQR